MSSKLSKKVWFFVSCGFVIVGLGNIIIGVIFENGLWIFVGIVFVALNIKTVLKREA